MTFQGEHTFAFFDTSFDGLAGIVACKLSRQRGWRRVCIVERDGVTQFIGQVVAHQHGLERVWAVVMLIITQIDRLGIAPDRRPRGLGWDSAQQTVGRAPLWALVKTM